MKHLNLWFLFICTESCINALAAFAKSDSMDQQWQLISQELLARKAAATRRAQFQLISEGAASNQPQRIERVPRVAKSKAALLSIVKDLQSDHQSQQRSANRAAAMNVHTQVTQKEKQLLSSMGELDHELESLKIDQHRLEQSIASQRHDEELKSKASKGMSAIQIVGAPVWNNRNALFGLAISMSIASWFFCMLFLIRSKKQEAATTVIKTEKKTAPVIQVRLAPEEDPVASEVARQLAALESAIGKVKMPSDNAHEVAMQAMEAGAPDSGSQPEKAEAESTTADGQ